MVVTGVCPQGWDAGTRGRTERKVGVLGRASDASEGAGTAFGGHSGATDGM